MSSAKLLKTDILIAGGGIIGLSIARALSTLPNKPHITVLEKDKSLGNHGSTLNSGVLHSGIYYTPGSFKARHCPIGNSLLTKYCLDNKLPILQCGKLIVAKDTQEVEKINELYERAITNGVPVKLVDKEEALKIEPHLGSNLQFPMIWSPSTSVASPKAIFEHLLKDVQGIENIQILNGEGYKRLVTNTSSSNTIETTQNTIIETPKFINCGGLYADRIARDFNEGKEYALIPLKGLYMIDEVPYKEYGLKTVIYPIPPLKTNNFLGVHTTLTTDGKLKLGPTAVPSFWREDYEGFKHFKFDEFSEIITQYIKIGFSSKVFWYLKLLFHEIKKSSGMYFLKEGKKLINVYDKGGQNENPKFKPGKSAIRTQLISKKDFSFMNDFIILDRGSHVHFLNMASPGWTSAMSLAEDMKINIQEGLSFEEILKRANENRKKNE